jgi:phosphatidylserine/phosphatidylglycerophosphate/cardiolipin synthase-like enzyme
VLLFAFAVVFRFIYIPLPGVKNEVVFYSNHLDHPLRHVVLQSMHSAKFSIMMHTYALTDEAVLSMLLKRNPQLEKLSIISDHKTIPSSLKHLKSTLQWRGIQSSGLMHQKVLIVDDTTVFLGTANMTYESLSMHDNVIAGFYSPPLAKYLQQYTQEIDQKRKHKNDSHQTFSINNQELELWMLPYQGNAPLDTMKSKIDHAQHSLSIAMFTLTHPQLVEAIICAHRKGVHVEIFLDRTSAKGASATAVKMLLEAHVPLYFSQGQQLLHHKMMLIDDTYFVLGSANWTKSAFKKNHDFYFILSPLHQPQVKSLKKLFYRIAREAAKA